MPHKIEDLIELYLDKSFETRYAFLRNIRDDRKVNKHAPKKEAKSAGKKKQKALDSLAALSPVEMAAFMAMVGSKK